GGGRGWGGGGGGGGAGARLGQAPRAHHFAAGELWQVLLLLLFVAGELNVAGAERVVGRVRQRDAAVGARDLFHDDDVVHHREPRAAVLLGHPNAPQAQPGHLVHDLVREAFLFIPLAAVGDELARTKVAHGVAKDLLLLSQREVHFWGPAGFAACLNRCSGPAGA